MLTSILAPATDAGVIALAITTIGLTLLLFMLARKWPGARLLIVGIGLVLLGLQALRVVH
jgi:Na+/phosphate symporter